MPGVSGSKFPGIRNHLQRAIGDVYSGLDLSLNTFPADDVVDGKAYLSALEACKPGDVATIFTPDDVSKETELKALKNHNFSPFFLLYCDRPILTSPWPVCGAGCMYW